MEDLIPDSVVLVFFFLWFFSLLAQNSVETELFFFLKEQSQGSSVRFQARRKQEHILHNFRLRLSYKRVSWQFLKSQVVKDLLGGKLGERST